jgi:prophage regulatory protein
VAQTVPIVTIKILRRPQVEDRTGLSRSTIYAKISANEFPKAVLLGRRAVGWVESEIDDWLMRQIQRSRSALIR